MEEIDNQSIVVYNTDLISYVNSSCWVDAKELKNLIFSKQYVSTINKLIHEYNIIFSINSEIEQTVVEISKKLEIRIEPIVSDYSFRVFVHNEYGSYCPFIFTVDYAFESENDINAIFSWPITRMYVEGDKSDLYFLFSNLMSLILKCVFQEKVYIDYLNLYDSLEISVATIFFIKIQKNLNIKKLKEVVEQICVSYKKNVMLTGGPKEKYLRNYDKIPISQIDT
ncbi:MAG: hypothetical protein GX638_02865 [Crenarchaeota archaeon]|nr:hypothetical protein [Thermoproteota archaeon]